MITPQELAYALEYFRHAHYGHLDKTSYQEAIGARFGWSDRAIRNWISGRSRIPPVVDYMCRLRYNYPDLSYDYVETLPLPSDDKAKRRQSK